MNAILRRLLLGAAAGVVATGTMTLEFAAAKSLGLLGEPPPRKLTRRILTLAGHRPHGQALNVATAAAHVGYGAGAGALFGLLPRPVQNVPGGVLYGVAIWAISYMGWIPKLGLMRRPSRDRVGRPTAMILAHVVYGATLGATYARLHGKATEPVARLAEPLSADDVVTVGGTSTLAPVNDLDRRVAPEAVSDGYQQ